MISKSNSVDMDAKCVFGLSKHSDSAVARKSSVSVSISVLSKSTLAYQNSLTAQLEEKLQCLCLNQIFLASCLFTAMYDSWKKDNEKDQFVVLFFCDMNLKQLSWGISL